MVAILIVAILLLFKTFKAKQELEEQYSNQIKNQAQAEYKFKVETNKKGEQIATQEQIILNQSQAIEQNILQINDLKKELHLKQISTIIKNGQVIAYDTTHVPYTDTPLVIFIDSQSYLRVPIRFSKQTQWHTIEGYVGKDSLVITKDSTVNETIVVVGYSRKWIWGKKHPVVTIKNTNPNFQITSMSNVIIKEDDGFFKRIFKFIIGKR